MKKLLIILFLGIFLFSLVSISATSLKYEKGSNGNPDLKVELDNTFLGIDFLWKTSEIGTAELKSHNSVTEIKKVGLGNQVVMYYDFNFNELYSNGLGTPKFINQKNGELVDREWRYVYLTNESYESPIYSPTLSKNGTLIQEQTGTETKTREVWKPYNSKDIPKGNIRIGIKVEVRQGDYIDGIWDIGGKKIDKHAEWTSDGSFEITGATSLMGIVYEESSSSLFSVDFGNQKVWNFFPNGTIIGSFSVTNSGNNLGITYYDSHLWITSYTASVVEKWTTAGVYTGTSFSTAGSGNARPRDITNDGTYWYTTDDVDKLVYQYYISNNSYTGTSFSTAGELDIPEGITYYDNSLYIMDRSNDTDTFRYFPNGTFIENINLSGVSLNSGAKGININNSGGVPTAWITEFTNKTYTFVLPLALKITLLSPENNANLTSNDVDFSANVSDQNLVGIQNVSIEVWNTDIDTQAFNETNTSGLQGFYNFSDTLSDANYNLTVFAYDDSNLIYTSETRGFTVDTTFPAINISAPIDGEVFNYLTNLQDITLNVTTTDTHLDTCFYEYNGTNTTFSCSSGVLSENNLTINNQSTVIVWANDTSGQLNSSTSDWSFNLFDFNNYTYDSNITESSSTTFYGEFQTGSSLSSAYLQYNNTNYSASIDSLGGNIYIVSATITSPSVTTDTNVSWNFWLNNVNTTSQNQTVLNINLDNCSSYSFPLVNYTLIDEANQSAINNSNSTIESSVILRTVTGQSIATFNQVFTGTSNATICSQIDLTTSGLRLWEQSRYGATNYVYEQHNKQNQTITSTPVNYSLYDLLSTDATTFRITYKSSTFLPIPNVVIDIQRNYLGEGTYKSVESPITDFNGEASASFDLNAVTYRIVISQNGTTIASFENPAIACDNILTGDCNIVLNEKQSVDLVETYDVLNDLAYSLVQDNRTISLYFDVPSGTSKLLNLYVNQTTILGNNTACNQTLFASNGQIDCTISPTLGDVFASVFVYSDGTFITSGNAQILDDRTQYFGTDNIVLTFFLVLSIVLLMVSSPVMVLIGLVVGIIGCGLMLLLNSGLWGSASVITYLIIVVFILIIKISMRERPV